MVVESGVAPGVVWHDRSRPRPWLAGLADGLAPESGATHVRFAPNNNWVPRSPCPTGIQRMRLGIVAAGPAATFGRRVPEVRNPGKCDHGSKRRAVRGHPPSAPTGRVAGRGASPGGTRRRAGRVAGRERRRAGRVAGRRLSRPDGRPRRRRTPRRPPRPLPRRGRQPSGRCRARGRSRPRRGPGPSSAGSPRDPGRPSRTRRPPEACGSSRSAGRTARGRGPASCVRSFTPSSGMSSRFLTVAMTAAGMAMPSTSTATRNAPTATERPRRVWVWMRRRAPLGPPLMATNSTPSPATRNSRVTATSAMAADLIRSGGRVRRTGTCPA